MEATRDQRQTKVQEMLEVVVQVLSQIAGDNREIEAKLALGLTQIGFRPTGRAGKPPRRIQSQRRSDFREADGAPQVEGAQSTLDMSSSAPAAAEVVVGASITIACGPHAARAGSRRKDPQLDSAQGAQTSPEGRLHSFVCRVPKASVQRSCKRAVYSV
jgi:hypothetical protein